MSIDKIITSSPVNKTASVVTGYGLHYECPKKIKTADSDLPLPVNRRKPCDYKGMRRGRLVVIGWSADKNGRLVVRCDCGIYTIRRSRSIMNENNDQDCCERCRHLEFLKSQNNRKSTC